MGNAILVVAGLMLGDVASDQQRRLVYEGADVLPEVNIRIEPNKPLTPREPENEGLALHEGRLYLLPEDIGRGAKVLRFKFISTLGRSRAE